MAETRWAQRVGSWKKSVVHHLCWSTPLQQGRRFWPTESPLAATWGESPVFFIALKMVYILYIELFLQVGTAACEQLTALLSAPRALKEMEISPQLHTDLLLPCSDSNFRLPWDAYEASLLKGCETVQGLLQNIKVNAIKAKHAAWAKSGKVSLWSLD